MNIVIIEQWTNTQKNIFLMCFTVVFDVLDGWLDRLLMFLMVVSMCSACGMGRNNILAYIYFSQMRCKTRDIFKIAGF